jgi:uncharacterized membrane protein
MERLAAVTNQTKFLIWFAALVFPVMFLLMGDVLIGLAVTMFLTAVAAAIQWVIRKIWPRPTTGRL